MRMRWLVLLFPALVPPVLAPPASAQSAAYYYCAMLPVSTATVYFSEVFVVPADTPVDRIQNAFVLFLAFHYKESISAKAKCSAKGELEQANRTKGLATLEYNQLHWRVIETHWTY